MAGACNINNDNNNNSNNRNTLVKVIEKLLKYKDHDIETMRMWEMRTETVPVIVGALGLII